ncbi:hypothetical protein VB715_05175 [Crocosphaera sp. UHCC 0190]|uniref:hypothetical protein n=1 Tax=Crocosphaera sp. UHCC 0190 TaxID=3110246 RepID=UPI002B1F956F|nr:hypothetical protein [Crocosphaera sp. UHCC 0190]MEA5509151.1 hypothetical protein [Crocosphaera sp. UHCC 0190]
MSQTPITVTYSLEEILKEINGKLDKIDEKFETKFEKFEAKLDNLQKNVSDLRTETQVGIESLKGEMKTLDAEVKGINKRLDSQEFINRSIGVGFILAFGTGVIKLFFPNFLH